MIGTTLSDIRHHIESLASPQGAYYLVCGRTGQRPVPAAGLSFDSRPTARAAATATEQYRTALRRYDPQLPCYDVIVCQRTEAVRSPDDQRTHVSAQPSLIDFCHTVAGVVFETIADSSHSMLQRAIMDRYLELAERVDHPDELCLRLIESIATELDSRLDTDDQADVLRTAATNLPSVRRRSRSADPLESALDSLQSVALLGDYSVDHQSASCAAASWTVILDDYPLASDTGAVVTLPLVIELFARLSTVGLRITAVERVESSPPSWRFSLTATAAASSGPLSVVREAHS
ncbi:DUF7551 domain-containing protein [Halohasta litorea]|uniref:Uncharacterized protein n=1 Tax=Halohasta litorea TaxID=869891 RepID=A0ABD6D2R9_9EURY|nr:hypothetical protein [Halohasta litorea]